MGRPDELPPDYVSLAQLRDIWMKKQEEKKLREKEEEERKLAEEKRKQEVEELRKQEEEKRKQEAERRRQEDEKSSGGRGYARIVVKARMRRLAMIEEKGKGKEVIVGGMGNVERNNKGWDGRHFWRPESVGGERNRSDEENEKEKEKFRVEKRVDNGKEVVPVNGVRGGIPDEKRMEFRARFGRTGGNRGPYGRGRNERGDGLNPSKQNEGASDFRVGLLDDKGYNEKRGERGRNNGGFLNRLKEESRDAVLKDETKTEKEGEGAIVEVLGEGSGLRGRGRNGYKGRNRVIEGWRNGKYQGRYSGFKEKRDAVLIGNDLELENVKKGEDEIVEVFNEKCRLSERDRNYDRKRNGTNEDKFEEEALSDERVALESKVGDGVSEVESVKNGVKEGVGEGSMRHGSWRGNFGKRWSGNEHNRYGNGKGKFVERSFNRFQESRGAVLIGNKLELETEKKAEDGISEVFNEKGRNEDKKRISTNEDRAKGEGSNGDKVVVECKVDDEVLAVQSVENGEKEGVAKDNRRFGNWKGKARDGIVEVLNEKDRNENKKRNGTNDKVALEGQVGDGVLMVESVKNGKEKRVGKGDWKSRNRKGKAKDENLEVFNENNRNDNDKRNMTNEDRAEGEGYSDDRVAVESKVDDGVLTMESVVNGEKEGVGEEWRFENLKGKAEDESLEVFNEKSCLFEGDKNDDDNRNKTNVDGAEREGSSDDRMALEKKVDDGVLMVERVKNAEKVGVGREGYGKRRNKRGNFDARRWGNKHNGFGNGKGNSGEWRLGNKHNSGIANRRGDFAGMKWVKKEDKSAAASGSSGVQNIESN